MASGVRPECLLVVWREVKLVHDFEHLADDGLRLLLLLDRHVDRLSSEAPHLDTGVLDRSALWKYGPWTTVGLWLASGSVE